MQTELAVTTNTQTALTCLTDQAKLYAANSKAANTIRAYEADWRHFTAWCSAHILGSMPANPETVALYITAIVTGGGKVSTITRRMAAISKVHQAAGHESPCAMKFAVVKEVLDGIKRTVGTAQTGKAALLTNDLRGLMAVIPDSRIGRRDAAILLLGFAGGFRRSELVALTVADVAFCDEGMRVTLRRSKTDQVGEGRVIGVPVGSNPKLCPVRALRRWLGDAGIVEGPLFRGVDRHGNVAASALTPQVVAKIVKRHCDAAGLDAAKFAGHSLRAGLATQAAINGASERSIMKQTGHKSAAMVRRYIRDGELFLDNAAGRLGL